jgi:hypothetical protein
LSKPKNKLGVLLIAQRKLRQTKRKRLIVCAAVAGVALQLLLLHPLRLLLLAVVLRPLSPHHLRQPLGLHTTALKK